MTASMDETYEGIGTANPSPATDANDRAHVAFEAGLFKATIIIPNGGLVKALRHDMLLLAKRYGALSQSTSVVCATCKGDGFVDDGRGKACIRTTMPCPAGGGSGNWRDAFDRAETIRSNHGRVSRAAGRSGGLMFDGEVNKDGEGGAQQGDQPSGDGQPAAGGEQQDGGAGQGQDAGGEGGARQQGAEDPGQPA
mgnify:CR=1 FL=1